MAGRQLLLRRHRLLHGADLRRSHGRAHDRRPPQAAGLARPHERAPGGAAGGGRHGALSVEPRAQGAGASPDFWKPVGALLPPDWSKEYFGWPGLGDEPPDPAVNGMDDLVRLVA